MEPKRGAHCLPCQQRLTQKHVMSYKHVVMDLQDHRLPLAPVQTHPSCSNKLFIITSEGDEDRGATG